MAHEQLRSIVVRFPEFLKLRRRVWQGISAILDASGLTRPALFLLVAIAQEIDPDEHLTQADLESRLFNPYATIFGFTAHLPELVAHGFLNHDPSGYVVTPAGAALARDLEMIARAHMQTIVLPAPIEPARLAANLMDLAHRAWLSPEPALKAHQARAHRRPAITTDDLPLVQIEAAILALWEARDDAHIAAWREAGFTGPRLDVLSRLWRNEAQSLTELTALLANAQHPEDIVQSVAALEEAGYVIHDDDRLRLTEAGHQIRESIEAETDRVGFATWNALTDETIAWLDEQVAALCAFFAAT